MTTLLQKSLKGEWFAFYYPSVSVNAIRTRFELEFGYPPKGIMDAPTGGRLAGPIKGIDLSKHD